MGSKFASASIEKNVIRGCRKTKKYGIIQTQFKRNDRSIIDIMGKAWLLPFLYIDEVQKG